MSRKHALIGVEGPNDSAFVGKVLNLLNFKKFDGKESNLDSFWAKFRPIYHKKGGDLYERLDMPSIFFYRYSLSCYLCGWWKQPVTKSITHSAQSSPVSKTN